MSNVRSLVRIDPLDAYEVVMNFSGARPSVVLRTAPDPDQATVAFHVARQRLTRDQVAGELSLVHRDAPARTLLREPLGTGATGVGILSFRDITGSDHAVGHPSQPDRGYDREGDGALHDVPPVLL